MPVKQQPLSDECSECLRKRPLRPNGVCYSCSHASICSEKQVIEMLAATWYHLSHGKGKSRSRRKAALNPLPLREALIDLLEELK